MQGIRNGIVLLMATLSTVSFAGKDPVAWQLSPTTGFPTTHVGNQSKVTYTFTSNLPGSAKMITSLQYSPFNVDNKNFTINDNCNGVILKPKGTCTVAITYSPTVAGTNKIQLIYGYNNNRIPLPWLTATTSGTPSIGLSGSFIAPNPFPTTVYATQTPFVTAQFTNNSNLALSNCQQSGSTGLSLTPATAGTITAGTGANVCGTAASPGQLNPGESCYIYGQLTNLQATNPATLTASLTCAGASATAQQTFTIAPIPPNACTGTDVGVNASITLPNPTGQAPTYNSQPTYVYADNVVQFTITNNCTNGGPAILGNVSFSASSGSATITQNASYDNCSSQVLSQGQSCTVSASVIPTQTGNLSVQASVTGASANGNPTPSTGTTSTTGVQSNQTGTHHFYFVNQCPFQVWYGIGNAAGAGSASPDPNVTTPGTGVQPSAYLLAQPVNGVPSTIDLSLSAYYNGALWPRTGCTFVGNQFACATGTCTTIANTATCVSGTSTGNMPIPPYTKIEEDLQPTSGADGVYDVSVINGMTVPVEMKAFGPSGANQVGTSPGNTNNVYTCSSAGAITQPAQSNLLKNSSWVFNPASSINSSNVNNDFYWVTPGADDGCTSSSGGQLCGMAFNVAPPANPGQINRRLGGFLGFATLANYAGYPASTQWGSQNLYSIFGMGSPLPGYTPANYVAMITCSYDKTTGYANSCYQSSLSTTEYNECCGCVNWSVATPNTPCGDNSSNWPGTGTNTLWTTTIPSQSSIAYTVQQAVTWLKSAAPTVYAYQFDDPSSSFQCNTDNGTNLYTSYQITFCPGGISGLPAGAPEGRDVAP